MKRSCELCDGMATFHCESDQASLCWDCDAKVHSANFLVARHSRNLLCHVCQSPTKSSASGAKLDHNAAVCRQCVHGGIRRSPAPESASTTSTNQSSYGQTDSSSSSSSSSSPPYFNIRLAEEATIVTGSLSRRRITAGLQQKIRTTDSDRVGVFDSGILEALRRLHREETGSGVETLELCTLSDWPRAVDVDSYDSS